MNSQASKQDFDLEPEYEPLVGKSLEQVIAEGESAEEKENQSERVSVNSFPQWLRSVVIYLKHKHRNAANVSVIERLIIKLGIAIARQNYGSLIEQIQNLKLVIFETGNQILLMKTYGTSYRPQEVVGAVYHRVSVREWETGAITELFLEPLGLPSSTAILVALICGVSASIKWVPRTWVTLAKKEMDNFQQYLQDEVTRLERITKSL